MQVYEGDGSYGRKRVLTNVCLHAAGVGTPLSQKLLLVDCLSGRFTSVKLRPRQRDCPACGSAPSITAATLPAFDYASFTGQSYDDRCFFVSYQATCHGCISQLSIL